MTSRAAAAVAVVGAIALVLVVGVGAPSRAGLAAPAQPEDGTPKRRLDFAPLFEADPPGTFELPVIREAAEFSVRDAATGKLVTLADLRGHAVVLSLFYTHCADGNACPLATATLRGVQRSLAESSLGDRVVLLSVTFDERRDTVDVLRAHRELVAAGAGDGWIFATPETAERRAALLDGYDQRIAYAPDGTITHPLRVYLIDGRGRVRQIYSQSFLRADVLLSDLRTIVDEAG